MELCWASEPAERALLGDIQPRLERIMKYGSSPQQKSEETSLYENCEEILEMSGIKGMFESKLSDKISVWFMYCESFKDRAHYKAPEQLNYLCVC